MAFTLLIEGWKKYPHSYAIVNVYQMMALVKCDSVRLFLNEPPPFSEEWPVYMDLTDVVLTREEQTTLDSIPCWDGRTPIDAIYRIAYPFNTNTNVYDKLLENVPIFVFYTAEFAQLQAKNFENDTIDSFIEKCKTQQLIPVTPSTWSARALTCHGIDPIVIPHGVDTSKYHIDDDARTLCRNMLGIPDDAFVFLNVSAMTQNKNIRAILHAFYNISFIKRNVFLVLKGIGELYACELFINACVKQLVADSIIHKRHWKTVRHQLLYIDTCYTYTELRALYNAADCYVSPYLAEGFNLPALEAMACGLPLILPKGGATDDFVLLENNETSDVAKFPKTLLGKTNDGGYLCLVTDLSLQEEMIRVLNDAAFRAQARIAGPQRVANKYTWDHVAAQLLDSMKMV